MYLTETTPIATLDRMGRDAPRHSHGHPTEGLVLPSALGASRHRFRIAPDCGIEALLINQGSPTLVVSLHGALDRKKYELPRFEWLATVRQGGWSALLLSDPTLELSPTLTLGWYAGFPNTDLHSVIASAASSAARAVDADRIIFLGSSGGGFASLQSASHLPGSQALVFNPQTAINQYLQSAQRSFVRAAYPHLLPRLDQSDFDPHWIDEAPDKFSAVHRYSRKREVKVTYVQNRYDLTHVRSHLGPFRDVVENCQSFQLVEYDGPQKHQAPTSEQVLRTLAECVSAG